MAAYLKHKEDGRIFIYTDMLAADPNLEPYTPEAAPVPVAVEPEVPKKRSKKAEVVVEDAPELEV